MIPAFFRCATGSSPRMRGARAAVWRLAAQPWIIPADAGSKYHVVYLTVVFWDHPRGCGEHLLQGKDPVACEGSSPRMRGAHSWAIDPCAYLRIIPADAGST